jgi:hypothetical protein
MLIQQSDFNNFKSVFSNIKYEKLERYITECQQIDLRPLIGNDSIDEIETQIENNSLTELNKTLLKKISPCLVYRTWARYIKFNSFIDTEVGIRVKKNNYSDLPTPEENRIIFEDAQTCAVSYELELIKYLEDNINSFTLYKNFTGKTDPLTRGSVRIKPITRTHVRNDKNLQRFV